MTDAPDAVEQEDGDETEFRSGFVCFVGRPNTGKSTLTNALVGTKVAITSSRPQTTRSTIRGIVNRPNCQLVLVDTPGLHRPRTLLGQRLNDLVRDTYSEVDIICLTIPADEKIGPGDKYILDQVRHMAPRTPLLGVVTKIDKVGRDKVAEQLLAVSKFLGEGSDVIPVSAASGEQVEDLVQLLASKMQPGPAFYPDDEVTDTDDDTMMAELIREAALEGVRDELPHSLAVVIEEVLEREKTEAQEKSGKPGMLDVHALLYVERPSQKAIIIGKGGSRLKAVGTQARTEIEKLLGRKVFLSLHVKVAKDWQRDPKQLGRLGF
ncbi:GTPase Era [Tsukamurella strandjordii]|uniref:GTPase Era n=1 Tax=Tsukamurella strandjordii TaxID=147577 RepID=A0AA90SHM2_9ACTN|nr:GTPase Era [Tsukamurella strandjordii]MDP0398964.1 GTPase Era [Tsukamurella strandjordii]